jgi:hypothetical protein
MHTEPSRAVIAFLYRVWFVGRIDRRSLPSQKAACFMEIRMATTPRM